MIDTSLVFSDQQSIAAATGDIVSQNVYDTGAAFDSSIGEDIQFAFYINTVPTSAGAATIQFVVQSSADNSTWTDEVLSPAFAYNAAPVNATGLAMTLELALGAKRYLRTVTRIGGAATTGGVASAYAGHDFPEIQYPASGFVVS